MSSFLCTPVHGLRVFPAAWSFARRSNFRCTSAITDSTNHHEDQSTKVGFLGLGIMGSAMARNLINAGYDVTVWNRSPEKCQQLISHGAKHAVSPAEVARKCDVTFAMLADPAAAMEVACGSQGAISGLGANKGYVDASTVDKETSKAICSSIKASGASFLEAPVSGSKKPAEEGKLIFLTAGDVELYNRVAPMLDVMGKSRFYLGEVGNGAAMKLIVNMIMGSMMASFSEGLSLGKAVGIDPHAILDVLAQGAINAPMFAMKGPSMIVGDYPAAFPLKHQQKDLRLALRMAEDVEQHTPIASASNEIYKLAKANGLGDKDFSAVIEVIKQLQTS